MLVKFEQNRIVQITRNFELFDKNACWQSVDAFQMDVSVAEAIVWC